MIKTTVQVRKETLERLKLLKLTSRESYNEIIIRMIEQIHKQD